METKLSGYGGKFLRVDLTSGRISTQSPSQDFYDQYIGGTGFIVQTLLKELPPGIDPLGPENKLVFALGPFTGHALVGGGRNSIGAKSPLTGGFGESEAGGFWGARLRRAGYDAVIVEGSAKKPVYLWIDDDTVEIRKAEHLWGNEIAETEKAIQGELGDGKISTAVIGPGGERLVRYACIINDIRHAAGRTGMGAVMGSKKLKAIAVRGTRTPEAADRRKLVELSRWMGKNYKEKSHVCDYGTGATMVSYEASGNLPIRNFSGGFFPGVANITPQVMFAKGYVQKMDGCFGCPLRCKRRVGIERPWQVEPVYGGPEYETLAGFGPNCGVDNIEAIIKASEICNRFGIDTISTAVCVSFAMECYERGIIELEETGGIELKFGNAEGLVHMVEAIALRKGLGDLLAEGTKIAAETIGKGSEKFGMQVKGVEIPMHEPRYKQGMGLHYSIHATGPDHCTGIHDDAIAKNPKSWESIDAVTSVPSGELSAQKARMLYHMGLWRQIPNFLGMCLFVPWTYKQIIEAMEAVTGKPSSSWKLMKAAERGLALERIFNIRQGFSAADDTLPERFFTAPSEGPLKNTRIDPEKLSEAQKYYYQMLGWDLSGVPTAARLAELNIEWASEFLPGKALSPEEEFSL